MQVCDRITVLRNGELVGEYKAKELPRVQLVAKMMGKDFRRSCGYQERPRRHSRSSSPWSEAEGLGHQGTIKPFDFTVHKGEVVGLSGLLGSGRSELVRAIYGADKADSGTLKVNGKEVKIKAPIGCHEAWHGLSAGGSERKTVSSRICLCVRILSLPCRPREVCSVL